MYIHILFIDYRKNKIYIDNNVYSDISQYPTLIELRKLEQNPNVILYKKFA